MTTARYCTDCDHASSYHLPGHGCVRTTYSGLYEPMLCGCTQEGDAMKPRESMPFHWRAHGGTRRYHSVGEGKNRSVCGLIRPWSRTAYAVDATNTCPKCWKFWSEQGAQPVGTPQEKETGR